MANKLDGEASMTIKALAERCHSSRHCPVVGRARERGALSPTSPGKRRH